MGTKLWMSGEIEGDVYDDYRVARSELEAAMNAAFESSNYGDGLKKLALIPIIRETDHPTYCEVNKYWKKDRSFESRLKIPHAEFKAASDVEKRKLIVDHILRSIEELRRRRIPGIDCAKLESDVREVAAVKGWA